MTQINTDGRYSENSTGGYNKESESTPNVTFETRSKGTTKNDFFT